MKTLRMTQAFLTVVLGLNLFVHSASAQTETVLANFSGSNGAIPYSGVVRDAKGNLYGTTNGGGANQNGTVFKVTAAGKQKVLYSFCSQTNCADGASPYATVILDAKGNLYGTTTLGGADNDGVVFMISPAGKETVLHSFTGSPDGEGPYGGLVFDKHGNLWGTTPQGGANGTGTVFEITASGSEHIFYTFPPPGSGAPTDPYSTLVFDKKGNLYGTTISGGQSGVGTVFKLTPKGVEKTLLSFDGSNGMYPYAGVVLDAKGNIYGVANEGGANSLGSVFKLAPSGKPIFVDSLSDTYGGFPYSPVVLDSKGNAYGTAALAGTHGFGTVFEVSPSGTLSVMYGFCVKSQCDDGAKPLGGLILDPKGTLYGSTGTGGTGDLGTVFKLVP